MSERTQGLTLAGLGVSVLLFGLTPVIATAQMGWGGRLVGMQPPAAPGADDYHPGRVLVRFRADAEVEQRQAAHAVAGALETLREYQAVPGLVLVRVPAGTVRAAVAAYVAAPAVLYAEPDYRHYPAAIPNDPYFGELWGLHNTGQTVNGDPGTPDADIDAPEAWDIWTGDPDLRIGVIDSGINYEHEDLAGNMWTNPGEIPGNEQDDDGNGYVDDVHGYDFFNDDGDPMDYYFHGSHCAGTIGAVGDNGIGVVGVNWRCSLVALVTDYWSSTNILALQYCMDNGVRISNNSYSSGMYSQAFYDAIEASQSTGHIFVAAAHNYGSNNDADPVYPASFDLPNIIAVAAIDNDDHLTPWSNWGATSVDLAGPGDTVLSTVLGQDYQYEYGTSMATPHVAGVAGLVMSRFPELPWRSLSGAILDTVRPVESLQGRTVTGGVVNAYNVLARLTGDCNGNGEADGDDIGNLVSPDCNYNGVPDECDLDPNDPDGDGRVSPDCQPNGVPDECDIAEGTSADINANGIPDECECVGDITGDGHTDQADLGSLLAYWGCTGDDCIGDIDHDGFVGQTDLGILLADWGCSQ
jgi:subtilisin family serine protease